VLIVEATELDGAELDDPPGIAVIQSVRDLSDLHRVSKRGDT
jgi:hypothetical protein